MPAPRVDASAAARRSGGRRDRFEARYLLWDESTLPRLRKCGRVAVDDGGVAVRATGTGAERVAGFSGVSTCSSVWACPVCAAKVAAHRRLEIDAALGAWHAREGRVGLLTLTMRHHKHHRLADLWDALGKAWQRVTGGRQWKADQLAHGTELPRLVKTGARAGQTVLEHRVPVIRAVEVTHGRNGWHVHIHALLFLRAGISEEDAAALGDRAFARWHDSLIGSGLPAPTWKHGLDCRRLNGDPSAALGEYFTKVQYSAASEVASSGTKTGRAGNRTPFQLLAGVVAGEADDLDLWHEWEAGSHGRRQITWSSGLRVMLGLVVELTDQEIVEADALRGDVVARVPLPTWRVLARDRRTHVLLELAEVDDDGTELRRFLDLVADDWVAPPEKAGGRRRLRIAA